MERSTIYLTIHSLRHCLFFVLFATLLSSRIDWKSEIRALDQFEGVYGRHEFVGQINGLRAVFLGQDVARSSALCPLPLSPLTKLFDGRSLETIGCFPVGLKTFCCVRSMVDGRWLARALALLFIYCFSQFRRNSVWT